MLVKRKLTPAQKEKATALATKIKEMKTGRAATIKVAGAFRKELATASKNVDRANAKIDSLTIKIEAEEVKYNAITLIEESGN